MGGVNAVNNSGCNNGNGSSGTDKAIARLLYAMLRQKSLKDIDWDQVARDPALLEEISNGHAARMRFSRFRTTVENQAKSRRSRLSGGSTSSAVSAGSISSFTSFRVSKPKRDAKDRERSVSSQKGIPKWKQETSMKTEDEEHDSQDDSFQDGQPAEEEGDMNTALSSLPLSPPKDPKETGPLASRVKKRKTFASSIVEADVYPAPRASVSQTQLPLYMSGPSGYGSHALERNLSSSSAPEMPAQLQMRHLTPCSDIDQASAKAAADAFDFNTATAAAASIAAAHYGNSSSHETAWIVAPGHQNYPQQHQQPSPYSPSLGAFDISASMGPARLTVNHFCQAILHQQQPQQGSVCLPGLSMEHPSMAPQAYPRHCSEWDTLLSQSHSQSHNI